MTNVRICWPPKLAPLFSVDLCAHIFPFISQRRQLIKHALTAAAAIFHPLFCFIFGRATYIDRKRSEASAVLLTLLDAVARRSCSGYKVNFPVGRRDRKVRARRRRRHRVPVSTRKCRNSPALSSDAATRYAFRAAQTFVTHCSHGKRLRTSLLRVR